MGALPLAVLLLSLAVLCTDAAIERSERKVVCYYTTWSAKRPAPYNFTPNKIDPFLCTHIIYAFADIGFKNNLISSDPDYDFTQRGYANITGLKAKNKDLKVMIGIGGWAKGSLGFGRITANETNRKEFSKNAVRFLRGYKFDGLDLNWQHPTFREGGTPEDRQNYVFLAQTLRDEFEKEAVKKNKQKLLLSIAISHNQKFLPAYDIPSFNNYMDFISVICYDYHFSYESAVNHHAPLYSLEQDTNYDATVNINYTIQLFSELADPEKLVLGVPTYGRTYKLDDPADTALGSYADGAGDKGPITKENGWFAYFEICNFVNNEGWTVVQTKPGSAGPYAYKGDQWVCYDDIDMMRHKADFANNKNLGGVMFWTIDYDDFLTKCGNTSFPLIRAARDALIPPYDDWETDRTEGVVDFEDEDQPQQDVRTDEAPAPKRGPAVVQPLAPRVPGPRETSPLDLETLYVQSQQRETRLPYQPSSSTVPPTTRQPQEVSQDLPQEVSQDLPQGSDVSVPQTNMLADLMRLIEKAGGLRNLNEILRLEKARTSVKKSYKAEMDSDNSLVLESKKLPPLLLIMNNASIYIKEFNIYQKP